MKKENILMKELTQHYAHHLNRVDYRTYDDDFSAFKNLVVSIGTYITHFRYHPEFQNKFNLHVNKNHMNEVTKGFSFLYNSYKHKTTFIDGYKTSGGFSFPISFPLEIRAIENTFPDIPLDNDEIKGQRLAYENSLKGQLIKPNIDLIYNCLREFHETL